LLAEGQAFLNGFIVQVLAAAMHVSVPEALEHSSLVARREPG
jgi:hypothetical protein